MDTTEIQQRRCHSGTYQGTPESSGSGRSGTIPQAPGPEKGVLALMAMDPATYVGNALPWA